MKKYIFLLAILSFVFIGCSDDNDTETVSDIPFLEFDNTNQKGITTNLTNPTVIKRLDSLVYYKYTNWNPQFKMNNLTQGDANAGCEKIVRKFYYNEIDLVDRIEEVHYRSGDPNTHFGNPNGFYKETTYFQYENQQIVKQNDNTLINEITYEYANGKMINKTGQQIREEVYNYFEGYFKIHILPYQENVTNSKQIFTSPENPNVDIYIDVYLDSFRNQYRYVYDNVDYKHTGIKNIFNPIANMFPTTFTNGYFDFTNINSVHFSSGNFRSQSIFQTYQFIVDQDHYPRIIQVGNYTRGEQYYYYYKN